ncbi:MAG: HNH endonuclease [Bacteroidia bacterium]
MGRKKCIFCRELKDEFTAEHVFPSVVGGVFSILNVCKDCNEKLGKNIDNPLSRHPLILYWRNIFQLSRKDPHGRKADRNIPNPFPGKHKGEDGNDYIVQFNEKGQPTTKIVPRYEEPKPVEGGFMGKFTFSPQDFPTEEDAKEAYARKFNLDPKAITMLDKIENAIKPLPVNITADNEPLVLGTLKIAYEFTSSFIPSYLNDPLSKVFAEILLTKDYQKHANLLNTDLEAESIAIKHLKSVEWLKPLHHAIVIFPISPRGVFCAIKLFTLLFVFKISDDSKFYSAQHLLLLNDPVLQDWWVNIPYEAKKYSIKVEGNSLNRKQRRLVKRMNEDGLKNKNGKIPIYNNRGHLIKRDVDELRKEILVNPARTSPINNEVNIAMAYPKGMYFVKHNKANVLLTVLQIEYIFDAPQFTGASPIPSQSIIPPSGDDGIAG